jgi:hypothetical protein
VITQTDHKILMSQRDHLGYFPSSWVATVLAKAYVDAVLFILGHGTSQLRSHKVELISEGADTVKVTLNFARISAMQSAYSRDGSPEPEQRLTHLEQSMTATAAPQPTR